MIVCFIRAILAPPKVGTSFYICGGCPQLHSGKKYNWRLSRCDYEVDDAPKIILFIRADRT